MTQPPDNPTWLEAAWRFAGTIGATVMAGFWWLIQREVKRVDTTLQLHTRQISELQKDRVTKDDMDELRSSLTATIVHGFERTEKQFDTRHRDNQENIQYIRSRLDKALDKS